jgi:hypothetical protein
MPLFREVVLRATSFPDIATVCDPERFPYKSWFSEINHGLIKGRIHFITGDKLKYYTVYLIRWRLSRISISITGVEVGQDESRRVTVERPIHRGDGSDIDDLDSGVPFTVPANHYQETPKSMAAFPELIYVQIRNYFRYNPVSRPAMFLLCNWPHPWCARSCQGSSAKP